jgi:hypothetical protein
VNFGYDFNNITVFTTSAPFCSLPSKWFCLFVCCLYLHEQFFSYLAAVTINGCGAPRHLTPVMIQIRIDHPHLHVCCMRKLNGAVLWMRPTKNEVPYRSRFGTIKIPPCSKALRYEHRLNFAALRQQLGRLHINENSWAGRKTVNNESILALTAFSNEGSFTCHASWDADLGLYSLLRRTATHVPQSDSNPRRKDHQIFAPPL